MTTYKLETIITKNSGICRVCNKKINSGEPILRCVVDDYYKKQFSVHIDCMLNKLITDLLQFKQTQLDGEIKKFKIIQKALGRKKK